MAEHPRYWGREPQVFDSLRYPPRLERRPHYLAFGRLFAVLDVPKCSMVPQHRRERELAHGRREYVHPSCPESITRHRSLSAVSSALPF